ELLADGQADRALAVARGAAVVANRDDFWMMALYMRLRDGRIWYVPGFAQGVENVKWMSILNDLQAKRFVAITGSGVSESFYGDSRYLASGLAQDFGFPLAPHQRDDLPQVSQYLTVTQSSSLAVTEVRKRIVKEVLNRHGGRIPQEIRGLDLQ